MKGDPGEIIFGRYKLLHPLGQGGFGRVFLARQTALERDVAVKASRPEQRGDAAMRERFKREALLVAGINHPNVVTYHDFGVDDDDDLLLVMEYLKGNCLHELLRKDRPLPLATIAKVVAETAAGLNEAHARGIVHRDVKPSNLFVVNPGARDERVKVIDFGILMVDPRVRPALPDLTRSDVFIGTPDYVAPEMMTGRNIDGRADQYALALVAFEMLAGRKAFPPGDEGGILQRLSDRPEGLGFEGTGRRVPSGVSAALHVALSPNPADRFPTITAFADAFREAASDAGLGAHGERTRVTRDPQAEATATAATRPEIPRRGSVARGAALSLLALSALAGLGLGIGAWVGGRQATGNEQPPSVGVPAAPSPDTPGPTPATAVPPIVASPSIVASPPIAPSPPVAAVPSESPATRPQVGPAAGNPRPVVVPARRPASGPAPASLAAAAPRGAPASAPAPATDPRPSASGAGEGIVSLSAEPWGDVWVDGRAAGRAPIKDLRLPAGTHRFEFRKAEGDEVKVFVRDVPAGGTVRIKARWDPAPPGPPSSSPSR